MKILLIDLQSYWREHASETLRQSGYQVVTLDNYEEVLQQSRKRESWDLVLLGCASIAQEERALVAHLIVRHQSVIVLSVALSTQEMRSLFLQGAIDVSDKTYHKEAILSMVERALKQLNHHDYSWALAGNGV